MTKHDCPHCQKGTIAPTKVANFPAKIQGIDYRVPEAEVGICNRCGAKVFSPSELQRWAQLFSQYQEATGKLLSASQISELRQRLGLSISDFALFMGCTRQTIHNWERHDRKAPQTRTADLLLKLVGASMRQGTVDVCSFLALETNVTLSSTHEGGALARTLVLFRPPEEFDRLFGIVTAPEKLPSLVN